MRGGDRIVETDSTQQINWEAHRDVYFNTGPARLCSHHQGILGYCRELGVALELFVNDNRAALDPARLPIRRQTAAGAAAQCRSARRHCRSRRQERAGRRRAPGGPADLRRSRFEPQLCRFVPCRLCLGRCPGRRQREGAASATAGAERDRGRPAIEGARSCPVFRRAVEPIADHVAAGRAAWTPSSAPSSARWAA